MEQIVNLRPSTDRINEISLKKLPPSETWILNAGDTIRVKLSAKEVNNY